MYQTKLSYGLRKEGHVQRLIHLSELLPHEFGLNCRCVCPNCGVSLVARLISKNPSYTPRFLHRNRGTCEYAMETALHMKAKELLEQAQYMALPRMVAGYRYLVKDVAPKQLVPIQQVVLARKLNFVTPHMFVFSNNQAMRIKITASHMVDDECFEEIRKEGIPTIEIDLSDSENTFEPAFLQEEIVEQTRSKLWLYHIMEERSIELLKEEYERLYGKPPKRSVLTPIEPPRTKTPRNNRTLPKGPEVCKQRAIARKALRAELEAAARAKLEEEVRRSRLLEADEQLKQVQSQWY